MVADESLKSILRGILQGRKYLLFLDDFVVGQQPFRWIELREILKLGSPGSIVILITDSSDVAKCTGCLRSFRLEILSKATCWSLFTRCAVFDQQDYPFLESIAKAIVDKCGGNALAIKALGSILCTNRDEHTWNQIYNHILNSSNIASVALRISLGYMPSELIQCFIASAIFLQDKVKSRDQLIYFWMALGLLQSRPGYEDLRDIGDKYCNQLYLSGFFQLYHSHYPSQVIIQMHSQARNLAFGLIEREMNEETRKSLCEHYIGHLSKTSIERLISNTSQARVLLLDHSVFEEFPETIDNHRRLSYLSLVGNHSLRVLPLSINGLVNLQTLDLSGCEHLTTFPGYMDHLIRLRHLLLSLKLCKLPEEVLKIPYLHLLKIINCQKLELLPEEIKNLATLRILQIHDCPSIASLPCSIMYLTNLKELSIFNCGILDLTGWSGLRGLTSLEFLHFQGLPKISELPAGLQSSGDSLQHLVISRCENLRALPKCLQEFTNLLVLCIDSCPNIVTLPRGIAAVKTLLRIINCPSLVARCVPERGAYWNLISHIPKVQLQNQVIQNRAISVLTLQQDDGPQSPGKGKGHTEVAAGSYDPSPSNLSMSSPQDGLKLNVQQPIADNKCLPPSLPPPPPPPLFSPKFAWRVRGKGDLDSQGTNPEFSEKNLNKQKTEAGKEAKESGTETPPDEMKELIVPRTEIESFSKGILFLLGEGYEFEKDKLIQLWMAGGFIRNEPMEISGATYFEVLMSEGYILPSGSNSMYKLNNEKVNFDYGRHLDKSNYLRLESTSQHIVAPAEIVHVSVVCNNMDADIFRKLDKLNSLRTLLFLHTYGSKLQQVPVDFFLSFESLLVLDLSGTSIKELPNSATKMIDLRFLDLSWTSIELLPEALSRFRQLQTLKLKGCSHLRRLPKEMRRLTELRHLDVNILGQLSVMPIGIGVLKNLRTLSAFLVGKQEGYKITELSDLNNLSGEFSIARLENVQSAKEAELASLGSKKLLKKLELRWSDFPVRELKNEDDAEKILKNLCPHLALEELQIRCYGGKNLPSWIADESFHKLTSITLFKCVNVSMLPSMQKLPSLEHLELVSLNSVVSMDVRGEMDHVAFPKLRKLIIDEMLNLETWTKAAEGDFPCLAELIIKDCPILPVAPSILYLSSMKRLEISCCPQIRLLPDKELPALLEFLIVEDCPLIEESWDMIKHVPNLWIDQEVIVEPTDVDRELLDKDRETDDGDGEELFSE